MYDMSRDPLQGVKQSLADTRLIGQAVGIVMHTAHIPADQASDYIHIKSVALAVPRRDIAAQIVTANQHGDPPTGPLVRAPSPSQVRLAPREPTEPVTNNLNAVLVGGPADGQMMHVSGRVDIVNVRRDEALHEYLITDEYEQLAGSMLLIWRYREHVDDPEVQ
jgi:ANTAR domain